MLISVIIPVYNAARYLPEALDSVLAQTFADYECVCVNDGSTDASAEILTRYERKFREAGRTLRIVTKTNGGEGSARNAGLDVAQGEYITWLDSDDLLAPTRFEIAAKIIAAENPDLVRFYYQMGTDGEVESWRAESGKATPDCPCETFTDPRRIFHWGWYELNGNGMVWLWFAKRGLLEGMRFRPEMHIKEDCVFSSSLIPRIRKLCVCRDCGLFYRQVPTSAMHGVRRAQDCINCQRAFLDLWNGQRDYAGRVGELEFLKYRLRRCAQSDFLDWVRMRDGREDELCGKGEKAKLPSRLVREAYMAMRNSGAFSRHWAIDYRYRLAMPLYELTGWLWPIEMVNGLVGLYRRMR